MSRKQRSTMNAQPDHRKCTDVSGPEAHLSNELFALLYTELKRHAKRQLRRVPPGQTLRSTALVHEAYERLMQQGPPTWESRSHFFAVAINVMRNVLIDAIRRKCALKRGGDLQRVTLTDSQKALNLAAEDLMTLTDALSRLEKEHSDAAHIVLLRFLAGFTMDEIANMEGVSKRTIERRWRFARAWLQADLGAS